MTRPAGAPFAYAPSLESADAVTLRTRYGLFIGGAWTAVVAAFTLGLSSYFFAYGVEIRPYPLLMLVATLEEAKPGDLILLVGFGQGADTRGKVQRATTSCIRIWQNLMGAAGECHPASAAVGASSAPLGYMAPPIELRPGWEPERHGI